MAGDQSNEITVNNSGNVEGNVNNNAESGSETKTKQSTDSKGDNTVMWIILAVVGVLVIGGVGYLATKRGGLSGGESVAPVSVTSTLCSRVYSCTESHPFHRIVFPLVLLEKKGKYSFFFE